jgi:hypothetical protein
MKTLEKQGNKELNISSGEWFQRRKDKELFDRHRDFGISCKTRLKELMKFDFKIILQEKNWN